MSPSAAIAFDSGARLPYDPDQRCGDIDRRIGPR
jgi:hypothetical protein